MTRYRRFFWPAVLILAGVAALLVNTGVAPVEKLILLVNLWPLILIVIGAELIVHRSLHGPTGDVAAASVVLLAVVFAAVYIAVEPGPAATHTLDASADLGDLHQASVAINAGAASISVSGAGDLGGDLYRAHIQYSGVKPDVTFDRANRHLTVEQGQSYPFGLNNGRFALRLQLNSTMSWTILENTGASDDTIDIPDLRVLGITVNTNASREEVTLGPPSRLVPIEINGSALTVRVHLPSGTEARVAVAGGAIDLTAYGRSSHAVGRLTYQSPGFGGPVDAYQVMVNGGACTVTIDSSGPAPTPRS
jgi:hypothetical protein